MLITLTRADGNSVGVSPDEVAEINRAHQPETWICFKGGGALPVRETVEELLSRFVPPLVALNKISDELVLIAPDCVARCDEGDFHGEPCVWIGYAPEHKRKAIAIADNYQNVITRLNYRPPAA